MAYEPHIRMTLFGTLPGDEIFSFGVAIAPGDEPGGQWMAAAGLEPNSAVYDDLALDAREFFSQTKAHSSVTLKGIKFAFIGADGKYTKAPVERAPGGFPTGFSNENWGSPNYPNQVALAATLHTEGDLGRVKGRFYIPKPCLVVDGNTISENDRDAMETAVQSFVNDVNDQPGLDILNLRVVVASQGRRNADGSIKIPAKNHVVTSVSVGRVMDTVRRRRNKTRELRGTPSPVS